MSPSMILQVAAVLLPRLLQAIVCASSFGRLMHLMSQPQVDMSTSGCNQGNGIKKHQVFGREESGQRDGKREEILIRLRDYNNEDEDGGETITMVMRIMETMMIKTMALKGLIGH
ncbi:unnamed protein product [Miscanthus lutarioriparius]|uniref:Secreted protein n=1 Tax=Miscanthus lutarioriparius TaxID=422564 RepID=A0A811RT35_9POAL|nr:unnamed protein product [Miscanthus lutarioriparius]